MLRGRWDSARRSARTSRWVAALAVVIAAAGVGASAVGAAAPPDANLVAAQNAVQRLLTLTPLPSGAVTQATDPSVGGTLSQVYHSRGAQQVIGTRYWTVSGTPGSVSHYIYSHPAAGSRLDSQQGIGRPSSSASGWQEERSFPGQSGRLTSELLEITTAPAQSDATAVRADAIVLWRPTWDQIPASARVARVTLDGYRQHPVIGETLARLRALVDTEPVVAPGAYSCPAGFFGQAIRITFADARGQSLAHIGTDSADGCQWLAMTVGARRGPALLGGWDLAPRLWAAGSLIHCTASQLSVSASAPSVDPSETAATITVHNLARSPCSARGTPSIGLVTTMGRRLPVRDARMGGRPTVVTAPAHGAMTADVSWSAKPRRCALPAPTTAVVGMPGVREHFDVALKRSHHRFGPCTGRLGVAPLFPSP